MCVPFCVFLYKSEGFSSPERRQEMFLLPHGNKFRPIVYRSPWTSVWSSHTISKTVFFCACEYICVFRTMIMFSQAQCVFQIDWS